MSNSKDHPSRVGHEFMERTCYKHLGDPDQEKGLPQPPVEEPHDETATIVDLPKAKDCKIPTIDLRDAIEGRRSVRTYSESPLSLEELSFLLWCTQGVKKASTSPTSIYTLRNVPSAGARHAFETYLLINRVQGLRPGLYRFLALEHKIMEVDSDPKIATKVTKACLNQTMVKKCAVTFIWVAVPYRMTWRYGERGYRYLHLDAGHVCQNLYLAAEAIDSGVCAIAAFSDEDLNEVIGLDGERQFVVYLATLGKKKKGADPDE